MTTTQPTSGAPRRSPARRAGCAVLLILWFGLLMVPCLCAVIAINQEIVLPLGPAPGQHVRAWLIMEAEQRGLGISTPRVTGDEASGALCVETHNRFVLWQGREADAIYCECYERGDDGAGCTLTSTTSQACEGG